MVYAIILGLLVLCFIVFSISHGMRSVAAHMLTPKGHVRYGDIVDTEANDSLNRDGFGVTVDMSSTAMATLKKKG